MANSRRARKSIRKNNKRRLHNRAQRSALRTMVKKCRLATEKDDAAGAESVFQATIKRLDKAAAKGLIHKNKAARTKSRLAKALHEKSQGGAE